jgi:hypothetical protein
MSRRDFIARLKKGYELQLQVATRFLADGFIVKVHPYQENKSDEYDIMVKPSEHSKWREVEVKGNGKFFTDLDDFPYQSIFVETVKRREKRGFAPEYYVIVSYDTGAALCIHKSTEEEWEQVRTKDTQKNLYDNFLTCPKHLAVSWDTMVGSLRGTLR